MNLDNRGDFKKITMLYLQSMNNCFRNKKRQEMKESKETNIYRKENSLRT